MNNTDVSQRIEKLKMEHGFETYLETVLFFHQNETDVEIEDIGKHLNQKIVDHLQSEAISSNMLKMTPPRNILSILMAE